MRYQGQCVSFSRRQHKEHAQRSRLRDSAGVCSLPPMSRPGLRGSLIAAVIAVLLGLNVYQYFAGRREMSRQEIIDEFENIFAFTPHGIFENRWLGIPAIQHPMDVWITQEILYDVKPDFVVECGTFKGGSAALWATILEQIVPNGRVITIDIKDRLQEARKRDIVRRKVDFLLGSSTDPEIVAEVTRRVKGSKVVVILDSLHSKEHVLAELRDYSPLVNVGSYIIVQDSNVFHPVRPLPEWNLDPEKDVPWEAINEFMEGNDEFEIDHSRERLLIGDNPNGFLRRIK